MDRVHRMGQQREVRVVRFVTKVSPEPSQAFILNPGSPFTLHPGCVFSTTSSLVSAYRLPTLPTMTLPPQGFQRQGRLLLHSRGKGPWGLRCRGTGSGAMQGA